MKKLLLALLLPVSFSLNAANPSSIVALTGAAVAGSAAVFFGAVTIKEIFVGKNDGWRGMRIFAGTALTGLCLAPALALADFALDIEYEAIPNEPIYVIKRINGIK